MKLVPDAPEHSSNVLYGTRNKGGMEEHPQLETEYTSGAVATSSPSIDHTETVGGMSVYKRRWW